MIRRVFMCCIWFVVLYFGTAVLAGWIVGVGAAGDSRTAYADGYDAGVSFGREHGKVIFMAAAVVAVFGTVTGVLPGTGKKIPKN